MSNLKGKNIIVTGASGGIGNSIVKKLNDNDANILATGTKIEKLEELKKNFDKIKILKFDISQSDKIEEFIVNASKQRLKEITGTRKRRCSQGVTSSKPLLRQSARGRRRTRSSSRSCR